VSVLALLWASAAVTLGTPPATAADWQEGAGPEWAKVLEAARAEGKVVLAGRPEMGPHFVKAFQRDTGVTMEYLGGNGRELQSRLDREVRSGNVTMDVVLGGASGVDMIEQGYLLPIKPRFMLPGVTDTKNWADGKLKWVDKAGEYMFTANEYLHCWPLFNSAVVKPSDVTSWQDLLKPQYKGKIAAFDPTTGGPGQAQAAYLVDLFGIDFVKKLYVGQEVKLARDSRQLVEWVARGVYPIALGSLPVEIERFKKAGITTLEVRHMTDGPGSLLGGSSVAVMPKGAPRPNAATVFLNWYASQPAQEIYASVWGTPSRRTDVKVANVPSYVVPKPGVQYLDQYAEDWYMNTRPKLQHAIVQALGR
jgi:ABC-type Fe3+ transport system substrate-binding protein